MRWSPLVTSPERVVDDVAVTLVDEPHQPELQPLRLTDPVLIRFGWWEAIDRAVADAGVDRTATYVTNAVKHFKFEPRGKRRIHSRPQGPEIEACRWWIEQERELIRPRVTVALGATAARSLFGRTVTISRMRGEPHLLPDDGGEAWVTVHPSFLLRVPEEARKREEYGRFVADLRSIADRAKAPE